MVEEGAARQLSRIEISSSSFNCLIETPVEVWENEKFCGNMSRRRVFPQVFRVLPNFHECLYNLTEMRRIVFSISFSKHRDEK